MKYIYNFKKPYPLQSKEENFKYGMIINKLFLLRNNISTNIEIVKCNIDSKGLFTSRGEPMIFINLKNCKIPVSIPSFSWSYTGHKSDVTPSGVLSHEIGHYVDCLNDWRIGIELSKLHNSNKISSYEPNKQEICAETMRLFILNPDLLRLGSPNRYQVLLDFNLKPIIKDSWQKILSKSHVNIQKSALNWINSNNKHKSK